MLWRAAKLNELRIQSRGQNDELYQTLLEIYETALSYRDSLNGKAQRQEAETAGDWLWWSTSELAARAGSTPRTIINHINRGWLQAEQRGRQWVIPVAEGKQYLMSQKAR